ncbi:hypothetical protein ONS95_010210 [Cadophora gregata]|uniref:uncharacterized protein n=1 Tax=Cadophora gregata TaxID=51156 RepID=UPI0026DD763E|nr:uncharacterized protein ONS95_010210 [Cadophora gregata]KAK0121936.1 hypothetical protein ONS95_010210 [Cadophora gregata]KAK0127416.1 hypothetical protein ONS96_006958 [Cadophora gregata f. sp. sojae]
MSASRKTSNPPRAVQTIIAGGAAGGVESLLTYPTEYIKTQQQLLRKPAGIAISPLRLFLNTVRTQGFAPLYNGAGVVCVSNASKSAVRFFAFELTRRQLIVNPKTGLTTPSGNLIAGLVAGITESVTVVTPGETIKTKLIDDRNRPGGPQYRSTLSAIFHLIRTEGIGGFYRGVVPVTLKQSSNAVVRFTSYNLLLGQAKAAFGEKRKGWATVVAGAGAGLVTVYATMPMDNVKTRLQAIGASEKYSGSFDCVRTVVREEGVQALWKGTSPRLVRLTISGAISFAIYEQVLEWTRLELATKTPALA